MSTSGHMLRKRQPDDSLQTLGMVGQCNVAGQGRKPHALITFPRSASAYLS